MVRTKADQDRGGHLTVPSIFNESRHDLLKNGFCDHGKVKNQGKMSEKRDQMPFSKLSWFFGVTNIQDASQKSMKF